MIPGLIVLMVLTLGCISHQGGNTPKETTPKMNDSIIQNPIVTETITPITATITPVLVTPNVTGVTEDNGQKNISSNKEDNFTVKSYYDSSTDKATKTVELNNWRAEPNTIYINEKDTVLIDIVDETLQYPMVLMIGSYSKNLGTSGAVFIVFNNKGIYEYESIIPSEDPSIIPRTYAKGKIIVR